MAIKVVQPTRADMAKCVARFGELVPCSTGVVDMGLLPESERTFLNVLGFSQPKGEGQFCFLNAIAICIPAGMMRTI